MLDIEMQTQKKFYRYLVSPPLAKDPNRLDGMDAISQSNLTHQYETDKKRVLLAVEQKRANEIQAIFERDGMQRYRISVLYHTELITHILQKITTPDYLLKNLLNMPDTLSEIIDCLYDPRLNFVRLERLISEDTQLVRDIITTTNSKDFYESIGRSPKVVRDLKGAFGILGVKGLQYLIPLMIIKRRIPMEVGTGQRGIEGRLWDNALSVLNAHVSLLKGNGVEDDVAMEGIILGLIEALCPIIVYKLFYKYAPMVRERILIRLERSGQSKLYELMVKLKLNGDVLPGIMNDHCKDIFSNLGERFKWSHTPRIRRAFEEESEHLPTSTCSQHTVVHRQATRYSHYDTLSRADVIDKVESSTYLQKVGIKHKHIEYLKTHSINEFSLHHFVGQRII